MWRSASGRLGGLSVTTTGLSWMPTWPVDSLDSQDSVSPSPSSFPPSLPPSLPSHLQPSCTHTLFICPTHMYVHKCIHTLTDAVAVRNGGFGAGTGPINLDETSCTGTEMRLIDCPFDTTHDCQHSEDAGVTCQVIRE